MGIENQVGNTNIAEKMSIIDALQIIALTSTLVPASLYTLYKQYNDDSKTFHEHLRDDFYWCWSRIPNPSEVLNFSILIGLVSTAFEHQVNRLYLDNPTSKTVIRNALGILVTFINCQNNVTISSTGVKYDIGHVMGNLLAFAGKAAVITAYSAFVASNASLGDLEMASLASNFICEPLVRVQNIISQRRQEQHKTNENYLYFAANDLYNNPSILAQGITEGLIKVATATVVGHLIFKTLEVSKILSLSINLLENKYLYSIGVKIPDVPLIEYLGGNFTLRYLYSIGAGIGDTTLEKRINHIEQLPFNQPSKYSTIGLLYAQDLTLKILAEAITSYLITPTVRIVQDYSGIMFQEVSKIATSMNFRVKQDEKTHNIEELPSKPAKLKGEKKAPTLLPPEGKELSHPMILKDHKNKYLFSTIVVGGAAVFSNSQLNSALSYAAFQGIVVGCIYHVAMLNKDKIIDGFKFVYNSACPIVSNAFAQEIAAGNTGAARER